MRFSRLCYDKAHRCPGWNGGGPKFAKRKRCSGGHIAGVWDGSVTHWKWRFLRCNMCDVVTWPYVTRYLSIPYWRWELTFWWRYR